MKLTPQQETTFRHITDGLSNKEIASEMNLSLATVKMHITAILKKYGLQNRCQLMAKHYKNELILQPKVIETNY